MTKFSFSDAYRFDGKKSYDDERLLQHVNGVFRTFDIIITSLLNGNYYDQLKMMQCIGNVHCKNSVKLLHLQVTSFS